MKKKPRTGRPVPRGVQLEFEAEENLKRSHSVLQATLDSTADGILVVDSQGKIERSNKKFLEMWRIPPSIIESREDDKALAFVLDQLKDPEQFLKQVRDLYAQPDATSSDTLEFKDGRVFERYSQPQRIDGKSVGRVWSFRDVTESARASRELRSSEEKFRALFENVLDGMYQSTPGGRALTVNPALVRMLGYDSEEELLRADIANDLYVDPQQRLSLMKKLDLDGLVRNEELTLRRKDGAAITVLENSRTVRDENGKILYYEGTLTDITERKRSEEALKRSEERFRAFVAQSAEAIWCFELREPLPVEKPEDEQLDWFFRHTYLGECNDAMAQMYGFSRAEEIIGKALDAFLVTSDPKNTEFLRTVIRSGYRLLNAESHEQDKYGNEKYFLNNMTGIIEGGLLRRVWGTQRDITEQKKAEYALRESEERYRQFFEQGLAGHFITTPQGKILACNPAFARIFGFNSVLDALSAYAYDLYPNKEARDDYIRLLKEKRKLENFPLEMRRKDGSVLYTIEDVAATFDEQGEITRITGYVLDVTERKQLEEQLRQAQKMESIGTLAGGIAHDFNNLLAIINGYATLLKKDEKDAAKRAIWSEAINKAVERGANVVRQLLTFAHKDAVEFVPIDVNKLIEEFMNLIRETFPESVESQIKLQPNLPLIIGDGGQLHQALLNLCLNARDSMPSGGTITITTNVQEGKVVKKKFSEAQAHQYVVVEVRDTGVGISKETQGRMFEPFFTTKEFGAGTGLGLAVVYGVVRAHHAFVDVDSEVGKGTRMRLYFAAETTASPRVEERRDVYIATTDGTETILLVEDEPMILDLLKEVLESGGYKVMVAQNGEEAVEVYSQAKDKIALVFSDMGLPKLGGWEAFQKMKQINPRVKAILASGYLDPNLRTEMIKSGARDFIQKPYIPDQILRRVREVIDSTS